MRRLFHRLLPIDEALRVVMERARPRPRGTEVVPLLESLGRVLAKDVRAPIDYPPFDRSEVDGYAVRSVDTFGADELNPIELEVVGSVEIGEAPSVEVGPGQAVEIATGAPMPRGADAVVMEEHCCRKGRVIEVRRSVAPRENVAIAGSDIAIGELVIPRGTRIGYPEIAVMAALGMDRVEVFERPRVIVFSTGNELVEPGKPLALGKVYDSNRFAVAALLRSLGAVVELGRILPDDVEEVARAIEEAVREFDMVVLSGGTSAGVGDVVYRALERVGELVIHGLATKPGKPTAVAVVGGKVVVGLPGFPYSAMSIAMHFLKPLVEALAGIEESRGWRVVARLGRRVWKPVERTLFLPVALRRVGGGYVAYPIPFRSGSVSQLLRADGVAVVSSRSDVVEEGSEVVVELLREPGEVLIVGSHDIALPEVLRECGCLHVARVVPVGSLEGLKALGKGLCDVAPTHLLDEGSGVYNEPFMERLGLRGKAVLVKGWRRRLVLAYAKGNPKGIKGFEDLLREDVVFVNRNKGSGTRTFVDTRLRELARKLGMSFSELVSRIRGYTYEVNTHTGVAAAIAQGRADVGVCIEVAAKMYGLDYTPLTWEEYDFAISIDSLSKPAIERFISTLSSPRLREVLSRFPGYEPHPRSGEIVWR